MKRRAVDTIVGILEGRIFSGHLRHGERLPSERAITEEFGISRTVAREAVKILNTKGLIDARPHHRPVVTSPNYDTALETMGGLVEYLVNQKNGVRHLFDVRIFVEAGLVRLAALDAKKVDIENLKQALADNRACIDDSEQFYATDMAFHAVLYSIPQNPIFPALHRSFCAWLAWHWKQMPRLPVRNSQNHAAHQAIFQAVIDRDPDAAEAMLRQHLETSWSYVQSTLE